MKTLRHTILAVLMLLVASCAAGAPAFAETPTFTIMACRPVPLPGPENILNPDAPVSKQVRATEIGDCITVQFPDPAHNFDRSRISDFFHDPRAFA